MNPEDTFPDLKGQAPLRRISAHEVHFGGNLFLTSKVRLHCDMETILPRGRGDVPFPDLKGQAPLRHKDGVLLEALESGFS